MRTRAKWLVLGGIATMSIALVHCVGDDPTTSPGGGGDAGGDSDLNIGETSIGPDTSTVIDAGADAASACAAGVSPCIVQIAGGGQNFCARDDQGKIYCWGNNNDGQLAVDPATPFSATPLAVNLSGKLALGVDVGGPRDVTAGETVVCARTSSGSGPSSVLCWGGNKFGQLGVAPDSGVLASSLPTAVTGVSGSLTIAVGALHVCSISADNSVQCWGYNAEGELGRPTTNAFDPAPGPVTFTIAGTVVVDAVTVGFEHTCTTNHGLADRVGCTGANTVGELGRGDAATFDTQTNAQIFEVDGPITASAFSANGNATCTVKAGAVQCWGENGRGEMGINSATPGAVDDPVTPNLLSGGIPVTGVQAGFDNFCAILDVADPGDGGTAQDVYCWGRNDKGQSGPGDGGSVLVPTPVPGLPGRAIALAGGSQAMCALVKGGTVWCWGENYLGELGSGDPGDGGISGPVKVTF
jgi:hypothetical protein